MNPPATPSNSSTTQTVVIGASSVGYHTHPASAVTGDLNDLMPARLSNQAREITDCNSAEALETGWWSANNSATNTPTASFWVGNTIWYSIDTTTGWFVVQTAYEITGSLRIYRRNLVVATWSAWQRVDGLDVHSASYRSTSVAQSITSATWTTLSLAGTADHDYGGLTIASNVVTINSAGVYDLSANMIWATSASDTLRVLQIETFTGADPGAGLGTPLVADYKPTGTNGNVGHSVSLQGHTFAANAKVRVVVYQATGGALNVLNSYMPAKFSVRRVG